MNSQTVIVTLLQEAYEARFSSGEDLILSNEARWGEKLLYEAIQEMRENGWIALGTTPPGSGNYCIKMMPLGILKAEEMGAAPEKLFRDNLELRRKAREYLVSNELRNVSRFDLEQHTGFRMNAIGLNLQVLELLGHIKLVYGNPRITSIGREQVPA